MLQYQPITCTNEISFFWISNFRPVLNVVFFLVGDSPASDFQKPGIHPQERIRDLFYIKPVITQ